MENIDLKETLKRVQGYKYMHLRTSCIKPDRITVSNFIFNVKNKRKNVS